MPLTQDQLDFFKLNGYLHIPQLVPMKELAAVREETNSLIEKGINGPIDDPSYAYGLDAQDKDRKCLYRINQLMSKHDRNGSFRMLLAYPPLLEVISQAVDGDYFASTVHSLVFKIPHRGYPVPWHQDPVVVCRFPVFNVDIYLDEAHPGNGGLWVIPGSHLGGYHGNNPAFMKSWTAGKEEQAPGAVAVRAQPGDVLFHSVSVVHGSFWNRSDSLRRTIYFHIDHFTDIALKPRDYGHRKSFIDHQKLMQQAIELRQQKFPDEKQFDFRLMPEQLLESA